MKLHNSQPIFYITRDIERAAGLLSEHTRLSSTGRYGSLSRGEFFVITNLGPLAETLARVYKDQVIIISEQEGLSTLELLRYKYVQDRILAITGDAQPNVLVFKTSPQIEKECARLGWNLLNPPHAIGAVLEEKIGQWRWLQSLVGALDSNARTGGANDWQLPQVWLGKTSERVYSELLRELGDGPIVQFNRGHTGLGTFRLGDEQQWNELRIKFPDREVKASRFYEGKAYTVNAIVYGKFKIIVGNISEQLTGIPGCTNNPYATVGNDWSAGAALSDDIKNKIHTCAETVGNALGLRGYRGLFGIDVIVTHKEKVILIEVNPRQPASATMESQLQQGRGEVSMMEWHVEALMSGIIDGSVAVHLPHDFLGRKSTPALQNKFNGFQLFFRNTENKTVQLRDEYVHGRYRLHEQGIEWIDHARGVQETKEGELFVFSVSKNDSVKPGGELLRIQGKNGMVESLGKAKESIIPRVRNQIMLA